MAETKLIVNRVGNVSYSELEGVSQVQVSNTVLSTDTIEVHIYDSLGNRLASNFLNNPITSASDKITLTPETDRDFANYQGRAVKLQYNILRSTFPSIFSILNISPDRTEIKAATSIDITESYTAFLTKTSTDSQLDEIRLNFGSNEIYNCTAIWTDDTTTLYLKLDQPLPLNFNLKRNFSIQEEVTTPVTFEVYEEYIPDAPQVPTLKSPNFDIEVNEETSRSTEYLSIEDLITYPVNSTYNKLTAELGKNGVEINVDYSEFENFINYSSAKERLINFRYKLDLLYSYEDELAATGTLSNAATSNTVTTTRLENLIKGILSKFDGYERFLYFTDHENSWPKTAPSAPFKPQRSNTQDSVDWYTLRLVEADLFDELNTGSLVTTMPAYLKEDDANAPYSLFLSMIGQHFDNIWLYAKGMSDKYNTDNRLEVGISKDLIGEVLKSFGTKLYTSNFSASNLASAFLGEWFNQGEEQINTFVAASSEPTPDEDILAETYKRIYHNLPYLIKTKGTERGLRALINCFGIPDSSLKIRIFGGIETEETFPYFANQIGSGDKIRTDFNGTLADGSTLSNLTSIRQLDNKYTQDLHVVEVGFSTTYNVNDYIQANIDTTFDIDQYIGDFADAGTRRYRALDLVSKEVLAGISEYDVVDFFRLIKFFDNQLFKMVKDFIPARDTVASGLIVKAHALDRSKGPGFISTAEQKDNYEAEIDTAFISGSEPGVVGENSTTYTEVQKTPAGLFNITHDTQVEKINGELGGSELTVTDQSLNPDNPFLKSRHPEVLYSTTNYTNYSDFTTATPSDSNIYIYIEDLTPIFTFTGGGVGEGQEAGTQPLGQ